LPPIEAHTLPSVLARKTSRTPGCLYTRHDQMRLPPDDINSGSLPGR
jgi:hypothetical protein